MAVGGISTTIEVDGAAASIRVLGQIEPELRKQAIKEIKSAGDAIVQEARALVPTVKPLTNWYNWKGGFVPAKVRRGIKVAYRGSAQRDKNTIDLLTIRQTDPAGAIFELAGFRDGTKGRNQSPVYDNAGRVFIEQLRKGERNGAKWQPKARRTLWPAIARHRDEVREAVQTAVDNVIKTTNRKLY